ncbi:hypothetical protein NT04LM_1031, partial [Listeria monocytogenes FSL F2-208]
KRFFLFGTQEISPSFFCFLFKLANFFSNDLRKSFVIDYKAFV